MNIAIITSNNIRIGNDTKKGTEIVFQMLLKQLAKEKRENLSITAFCSEDSDVPFPIESVGNFTAQDTTMPLEKKVIFELALISKAFSEQDLFDLYHIHIGDGDIVLPFAQFVKKPILITIHHVYDMPYIEKFFSLFKNLKNVYFISLSNYQRKLLPDLNFLETIYNGIDTTEFSFDSLGADTLMWSGRGVPVKGLDIAFQVINKTKKPTRFFIIRKPDQMIWLDQTLKLVDDLHISENTTISFDQNRNDLVKMYQQSKAFLFPTLLEEACPLSALESMSCGTPVIAFARGALPELVEDGVTGFLINPSDNDLRGNFVIKQTGIKGLEEAIKRVYTMPTNEYKAMRGSCRKRIEEKFSVGRMTDEYIEAYKKLVSLSQHTSLTAHITPPQTKNVSPFFTKYFKRRLPLRFKLLSSRAKKDISQMD